MVFLYDPNIPLYSSDHRKLQPANDFRESSGEFFALIRLAEDASVKLKK